MKTKIDLEGLAPSKETFQPVSPAKESPSVVRPDPELEVWFRAIESSKGLKIECANPKSAMAYRFRLYRSRQRQQKAQNFSLDRLIIQIEGSTIWIILPPEVIIEDL